MQIGLLCQIFFHENMYFAKLHLKGCAKKMAWDQNKNVCKYKMSVIKDQNEPMSGIVAQIQVPKILI